MRDEWNNRQNGEEMNEVQFIYGYIEEECQEKEYKEPVTCTKNTPAVSIFWTFVVSCSDLLLSCKRPLSIHRNIV